MWSDLSGWLRDWIWWLFGWWLHDWQTLFTGVVALGVGGATVRIINRQIKSVVYIEERRRASERLAFYSMLEAAMGQVIKRCRGCQ
jgi:hypothetical protein